MKRTLLWFALPAVLITANGFGQTNYVATTPSSATPGSDNTLVGVGAGNLNMSGASNLFIGRGTGIQNMAGTKNAFIGASAGSQNTSGQNNSFVGFEAGFNNSGGNNNTFSGSGAGRTNGAGFNNTFTGYQAGFGNTGGNYNAFFGSGAGFGNTSGANNTFMGSDAGGNNNTGSNNTYLGSLSGASSGASAQNTFVGAQTGNTNTGSSNTFIGYQAGQNNQGGGFNVFVGASAGISNTTGLGNLFLGQQAGGTNSTGNYNLFIGNSSGSATSTGLGNTAVGDGSLLRNVVGVNNAAIGRYAGVESRGDENVFIGFAADVTPGTPNLTNVTAIGARARVSQSNSIVLGANANIGIGTSAPANKLEVVSAATNTSGLRLTNLKNSSPATVLNTNKFLTVDANGDVIMGSTNSSARVAATEGTGWEADGENLKNTNTGGVVVGDVSSTPAGYKLYVAGGVLTEKVKVAVKSTADWSDRVFDPAYRLRSLNEVNRFIQQNKHLPGVASAEEAVKEGVDVGQMQAKLLEKVEELTLYMIDLKKENETLRKKSQRMEKQIKALNAKTRK